MKIHSKKDIYYYYKFLFFSLLPLVVYGIIKNGLLVHNETNSSLIIYKPLIFFGINFILGMLLDLIIFKEKKINKYLVYLTILYMISSINTPIWLYLIGDILLIILLSFDKQFFNKIALVTSLIYLVNMILGINEYGNIIEQSGKYVFSFIDMIFIRQVGGVSTSNLLLVIGLLIVLLYNVFYKRNIALFGIIFYIIVFLGFAIFNSPNFYLKCLINSTALFEIIVIATLNEYSPCTPRSEIAYGILLGIIGSFLGKYISIYIGIPIAILFMSPIKLILEKIKWLN